MTREEEAIKNLKSKMDGSVDTSYELAETVRMAIEALKAPMVLTCNGCRHVGTYDTDFPCSVCIRREKDYYEQER